MAKKKKKIVPMNATYNELCKLKRDHVEVDDFCILTDSYSVYLSEQKLGEQPTQRFSIDRSKFNRLIRWYIENVTPRNPRKTDGS